MPEPGTHNLTLLLRRVQQGDKEAESRLFAAAYQQLRRMAAARMRSERAGHTLQPTALVNEAYLKLISQRGANWQNRAHFFAVASKVMRRILVDYARNRLAEKRGGGQPPLPLDEALVFSKEKSGELFGTRRSARETPAKRRARASSGRVAFLRRTLDRRDRRGAGHCAADR